jgi:uncharacterized protein YbjT (DUF2867 family)
MTDTVAVVGAAGLSGSHVLQALRGGELRVRAVVHGEAGGDRARDGGADEVVIAELAQPDSISAALEGANRVLMIPPALHPDEDGLAINALRAAEQAGVERFVYLSVLHPHTPELRHHMRKAAAEAAVRDSSVSWTILQPSIFAQMVCAMFGARPSGPVQVPFEPSRSFSVVDLADVAEVAAKVLVEPGHQFATYELAGPVQTMTQMVRAIAAARGVELEAVRIAPEQAPLPPQFAERQSSAADMRAMFDHYDRHGLRGNTTVLAAILDRPPTTFAEASRRVIGSG